MTLSLCMIVKNEEKVLDRCLSSTKNLFDEIIIVDTGSTDKTKEIAYTTTITTIFITTMKYLVNNIIKVSYRCSFFIINPNIK